MIDTLRRQLSRSGRYARTVALFTRVEWGLRTGTLPALCRSLAIKLDDEPGRVATSSATLRGRQYRQAFRQVTAVSRRWPPGDTCLRRCLVLARLLRAADPVLVIGVRKGPDGISAHSWLQFDGIAVDPMAADYLSLSR